MEKLRFEFTLLPSSDGKSNVCSITSITTLDNSIYAIPEDLQPAHLHKQIIKTNAYTKAKNSLSKRYQTRRVWIAMTAELKKIYIDEDDNIQFEGIFLEELNQQPTVTSQKQEIETKILEKSQEKTQSLKQVAERFVIEKFTSKNMNAEQWIDIFEKECLRFDVTTDEKKIEVLRLFMEKSCADWYSSMMIKWTINSEWSLWKNNFCETFKNKGWNPVTYALLFKYKEGSLLDYAIRKEKLLLEIRRTIDTGTLMDLIAVGLPEFILSKINREELQNTTDLFREVSKYEHMINKRSYIPKKKYFYGNQNTISKNEGQNPCKICEKLNKGSRYHPEDSCWFRTKENDKEKKNFIKHVNNAVIEAELNETNQKNA